MKSTAATCAAEAYPEPARLPAPSRKDQLKKGPEAHRRFGAFSLRTPKEVPSKAQTAPRKSRYGGQGPLRSPGKAGQRNDAVTAPPFTIGFRTCPSSGNPLPRSRLPGRRSPGVLRDLCKPAVAYEPSSQLTGAPQRGRIAPRKSALPEAVPEVSRLTAKRKRATPKLAA